MICAHIHENDSNILLNWLKVSRPYVMAWFLLSVCLSLAHAINSACVVRFSWNLHSLLVSSIA